MEDRDAKTVLWLRGGARTATLTVHVQPGARKTEIVGPHGDALKIRLAAPPVDGKANAALIEWAARAFGVPKARVELLHGAAGRQKVLAVAFDSAAALATAQLQVERWRAGAQGAAS